MNVKNLVLPPEAVARTLVDVSLMNVAFGDESARSPLAVRCTSPLFQSTSPSLTREASLPCLGSQSHLCHLHSLSAGALWSPRSAMAFCSRCLLNHSLRVANLVVNLCGMAMIIYSLWLLKIWNRGVADFDVTASSFPTPWYAYVVRRHTKTASEVASNASRVFNLRLV